MRVFLFGLLFLYSLGSVAADKACAMDPSQEAVISKLFSQEKHLYSLLWWTDPKSNVINARSFVINGHDSIPIFSSEAEGKSQVKGSRYEKDLVGVKPELLMDILQRMEYAILNPGGAHPIQFPTCVLKNIKGKNA